jgi:hypothetical protein
MEQPLRSRSTVSLAISDGTSALGAVASRDQYVLLRIPDCSTRLVDKKAPESAAVPVGKVSLATLLGVLSGLVNHWRRPRTLLTGALAVGLIAMVIALAAGNRKGSARHADDARHDGTQTKQASAAPTLTCDTQSDAKSVGALDEAPLYDPTDANRGRANQSARIEPASPLPTNPITGPNAQARKDAAPKARLEQRIDRVPSQY